MQNPIPLSSAVGTEVAVLMTRNGKMSQDHLVARLREVNPDLKGLNQSGLSKRLKGIVPLDIHWLEAIATVFDIDVTDLFPRRGEGVPHSRWITAELLGTDADLAPAA